MFWQNFTRLCDEAGKSPSRVTAELGLSNGTASNWKKGAEPQERILRKIAGYFGVSVDSLTEETSPPVFLAPDEAQLLADYRGFSLEGKGRMRDFSAAMKRSGMYKAGVDYFNLGLSAEY